MKSLSVSMPALTLPTITPIPLASKVVSKLRPSLDTSVTNVLNVGLSGSICFFMAFIATRTSLRNSISSLLSTIPDENTSPILDNADLILSRTPLRVLFASAACSPNASCIALENISNETWPLLTISLTSSSVLPRLVARVAAALRPWYES